MIKKRFYFNVGDTDEGRISLVRGFFFGYLRNQELLGFGGQGFGGLVDCPTMNETHSCPMAAYKEYTDADNTEGKEAYIEFNVDPKGEYTYTKMIELCNELIKLDEG